MKICIITGTRAEYGLLKPLIDKINADSALTLQLLVTAAHLSPEFGFTYKQIEKDGIDIDMKVEMLLSSHSAEGITKSMGLGMIGYADALKELSPDLLIILGDRYEMLAVASCALIFRIPIAHIHGGEITEGAYDDAIRNAITKMSYFHFTSTEEYRKRVIQMGEQPASVFNVGALGMDNIRSLKFLTRIQLENELNISFKRFNYVVTFHPETLSNTPVDVQCQQLLDAIAEQNESYFIFTSANADTNGRIINDMISSFVQKNPGMSCFFSSLGSLKFLSILSLADAIVGNSSGGIIEAPSLKTPTINIGNRQKGRVQPNSIVNCDCSKKEILKAFKKVKSKSFKYKVAAAVNPYGDGKTSSRIIQILRDIDFQNLRPKSFYNIPL